MQTSAQPYQIPRGRGLTPSIALAVAMHGLLLLMLVLGLSWRSTTPAVIDAQLWSALPQMASPAVEPRPVAAVEPVKPAVVPRPEPPPVAKADILIKDQTPKKVAPPLAVPPPPPIANLKVPEKTHPVPTPQLAPAKPSDLSYIQQQLAQEGKGTAAQNSGPVGDDQYVARLIARITPNVHFPQMASGDPIVTLAIEQLPTGEVTRVTILKSSGLAAFDEAAQRGVLASSPLPRDSRGNVARSLTLDYHLFPSRAPN